MNQPNNLSPEPIKPNIHEPDALEISLCGQTLLAMAGIFPGDLKNDDGTPMTDAEIQAVCDKLEFEDGTIPALIRELGTHRRETADSFQSAGELIVGLMQQQAADRRRIYQLEKKTEASQQTIHRLQVVAAASIMAVVGGLVATFGRADRTPPPTQQLTANPTTPHSYRARVQPGALSWRMLGIDPRFEEDVSSNGLRMERRGMLEPADDGLLQPHYLRMPVHPEHADAELPPLELHACGQPETPITIQAHNDKPTLSVPETLDSSEDEPEIRKSKPAPPQPRNAKLETAPPIPLQMAREVRGKLRRQARLIAIRPKDVELWWDEYHKGRSVEVGRRFKGRKAADQRKRILGRS